MKDDFSLPEGKRRRVYSGLVFDIYHVDVTEGEHRQTFEYATCSDAVRVYPWDPMRGEVVKAFVQLRDGVAGTPALSRELQAHVRTRLSAHEYPREIEFIEALPVTTTGKVKRADLRQLERQRRQGA